MIPVPGVVDLQVNGFVGVDFSAFDLAEDDIIRAWRALMAAGTTAFLATVITSPIDVYERNLPLLVSVARRAEFSHAVLGIHLEGPFISPLPGAVGAHDPRYVLDPDPADLSRLIEMGDGAVALVTLAAETKAAEALIDTAIQAGAAVSIGHSLFSGEDLARAHAAGARALTHLGNGLPNVLPRHPNPIWEGLAHDGFTAMVIADGHHLPDTVLKTVLRAKGAERTVVVSDAAPVAGLPPGRYDVLGNDAVLEPSGRLYNPEKQCLVGSSATMLQCMNHLASLQLLTVEELMAVGYHNPLRLIGRSSEDVGVRRDAQMAYDGRRFLLID